MNKKFDDCRFFIESYCRIGDRCIFRHCEAAKFTNEVCDLWLRKLCRDLNCPRRHLKKRETGARPKSSGKVRQRLEAGLDSLSSTSLLSNEIQEFQSWDSCSMKSNEDSHFNQKKFTADTFGNATLKLKNSEGWTCDFCTFINLPTRPGCEMCCAERPENYIIPKDYIPPLQEAQRIQREKEIEEKVIKEKELERQNNFKDYLDLDDLDVIISDEIIICPICYEEAEVAIRLRECLHIFCSICLNELIKTTETAEVRCPFLIGDSKCNAQLHDREIRALSSDKSYKTYLQRSLNSAMAKLPNSFHCLTPDCTGWWEVEDDFDGCEFDCPVCKRVNCLNCQAIHETMDCEEYRQFLNEDAENEYKYQRKINQMEKFGKAMNCPRCNVVITKIRGCDSVTCTQCHLDICWVTKGPRWGPRGRGDTSGGCRCGFNGEPCHPACRHCTP